MDKVESAITQNTKKLSKLSPKEINKLEYSQEIKEELLKILKIKSNLPEDLINLEKILDNYE